MREVGRRQDAVSDIARGHSPFTSRISPRSSKMYPRPVYTPLLWLAIAWTTHALLAPRQCSAGEHGEAIPSGDQEVGSLRDLRASEQAGWEG
jgi:hypothetical protein